VRLIPASLEDIRKAIKASSGNAALPKPEAAHEFICRELQDYRDATEGGLAALKFLKMKIGEDWDMWKNREEAFENVNTCKTAVGDWSSWLYGASVERAFWIRDQKGTPVSDELDRQVKQVYDDNNHESFFYNKVARHWFTDKWTAVKVWNSTALDPDSEPKVILSHLCREHVRPVYHPLDGDALLGICELRPVGNQFVRWLWTHDEVGLIDQQWEWLTAHDLYPDYTGPQPNPVTPMFPIVIFGDMHAKHPLADTLLHQRAAINRRSVQTLALRLQAFSKLIAEGQVLDEAEPTPGDGQPRIHTGPSMYHQIEAGGKMYYLSPNFPFEKFLEVDEAWLKKAADDANVSPIGGDFKAPEQPLALAIKMTKPMNQRFAHIALARPAELMVADLILMWMKSIGTIAMDLDIDKEIQFPRNPLPTDRNAERQADQADVAEYRMPLKDYVKKYHKPNADEKELELYLAELKREAQANQTSVVQQFLNTRAGGSAKAETDAKASSPAAPAPPMRVQ
jgi:hypothetical protein